MFWSAATEDPRCEHYLYDERDQNLIYHMKIVGSERIIADAQLHFPRYNKVKHLEDIGFCRDSLCPPLYLA